MLNLKNHTYFVGYTDPKSGVRSYILRKKIAPMQQHLYFTQPSITSDGKYLWIRCSYPPAQVQTMAVVSLDPKNPSITHFPQAAIVHNGDYPAITPEQDGLYIPHDNTLYKLSLDGKMTPIITLSKELQKDRTCETLMTHASISCDNKYIGLDMRLSDKWYIGIGNLQTGEVKVIAKSGRCWDHFQFSPKESNLFLIDQDWWHDYHSSEFFGIQNRIWLMDTDGKRWEPLIPNSVFGKDGTEICHDFWSDDGHVCWSDYNSGAYECNIETRETTCVWHRPICHSHTSKDRRFWCGDQTPYTWAERPCQTLFFDRESGKEIEIFSSLPFPHENRSFYHYDPHPQFVLDDKYIVSTTTVIDGEIDVAITPVEPLIKKCRENGTLLK